MTIEQFTATLSNSTPPAGLGLIVTALWHDAKGDWAAAHTIAQDGEGTAAFDRLHAYLHRKEGDVGNAAYWYRRAGPGRPWAPGRRATSGWPWSPII